MVRLIHIKYFNREGRKKITYNKLHSQRGNILTFKGGLVVHTATDTVVVIHGKLLLPGQLREIHIIDAPLPLRLY